MRRPDTALMAGDQASFGIDELVTIEAPTVEEAMARLASEVGENARIVSAEKAARGGIGGFFAREMVVLTARRPETDRTGLPGVLDRMARDADLREQAFGDVLRREMAEHTPDSGLGSLLAAAGWDAGSEPSTPPASSVAPEGDPAQGGRAERGRAGTAPVGDACDTPRFAAGAPTAADQPTTQDPAPIPVGPLVRPRGTPSTPAQPGPMAGGTIAERLAGEHLVMTPDRFIAATFPVVTSATASDAPASVDVTTLGPDANEVAAHDREAQPLRAAADVSAAPTGRGMPAWSVTELVRHGLPGALVTAVRHLDPRDDLAWVAALAAAVEPWCGPLPDGDRVIVGTGADRLAEDLGLALVRLGDVAPYGGSFCSELTGAADDRAWLDFVRGGRHLHFVLGEDELWRDLLVADPDVVSWVSPAGLVDALYLASTLGATLGYGSFGSDEPMVRCQPVDVALAIRRIVGRD